MRCANGDLEHMSVFTQLYKSWNWDPKFAKNLTLQCTLKVIWKTYKRHRKMKMGPAFATQDMESYESKISEFLVPKI